MPPGFRILQRDYASIPVGTLVRGSIGHDQTFRLMPGNGYFGTKRGRTYQQKFPYNPSDPNADNCGAINKAKMYDAMQAWAALSDIEKAKYHKKVKDQNLPMYGHNLFVKYKLLGVIP